MSCFAVPFPSFPPHLQYKETSSRLTLGFKRSLFGIFQTSSGEDSFKVNADDDVEPFSSNEKHSQSNEGMRGR